MARGLRVEPRLRTRGELLGERVVLMRDASPYAVCSGGQAAKRDSMASRQQTPSQ